MFNVGFFIPVRFSDQGPCQMGYYGKGKAIDKIYRDSKLSSGMKAKTRNTAGQFTNEWAIKQRANQDFANLRDSLRGSVGL